MNGFSMSKREREREAANEKSNKRIDAAATTTRAL